VLLLRPMAARLVHDTPLAQSSSFKAKIFLSAGVHFTPPAPRFSHRSAARSRLRNMLVTAYLDREQIHRLLFFVLLWLWPELQEFVVTHLYYQVSTILVMLALVVSISRSRMFQRPRTAHMMSPSR
jgi:hypothetical protein